MKVPAAFNNSSVFAFELYPRDCRCSPSLHAVDSQSNREFTQVAQTVEGGRISKSGDSGNKSLGNLGRKLCRIVCMTDLTTVEVQRGQGGRC